MYVHVHLHVHTRIYDHYVYRRLGGESNWEIVSCRACVRAQSVSLVRSRPQIGKPPPSLFPFAPRAFPFSRVGLNGIK